MKINKPWKSEKDRCDPLKVKGSKPFVEPGTLFSEYSFNLID